MTWSRSWGKGSQNWCCSFCGAQFKHWRHEYCSECETHWTGQGTLSELKEKIARRKERSASPNARTPMRNRWEDGPPHTRFQAARPRSRPPKSALKEEAGDKEEDPEETARQVAAMETMLKTLGPMVDTCDWAKKQHKELTDKLKKLKSTSEELPLDFQLKSY